MHYHLNLPRRVQRMNLGLYDTISNNDMELETVFSIAAVNNSDVNNRIPVYEQFNIENEVVPSSINVFDTEACQNTVSESELNTVTSLSSHEPMNDNVI